MYVLIDYWYQFSRRKNRATGKSQFSTFFNPQQMFLLRDKLITQGENRETSTKTCNETNKLRVFVSRISPPLIFSSLQSFVTCQPRSQGLFRAPSQGKGPGNEVGVPCQSSPCLTILVPLWFLVITLVFCSFVCVQNCSKCRKGQKVVYVKIID